MKFCIASDSHGSFSLLCRMLEREQPDCLLFLGDGAEAVSYTHLQDHLLHRGAGG